MENIIEIYNEFGEYGSPNYLFLIMNELKNNK